MIDFDYVLKRSGRRSISVKISEDNTVVVTAPYKTPLSRIESFLQSKSNWIERHIKQNSKLNSELSSVISYKTVLVKGCERQFEVGGKNAVNEDKITVTNIKNLKKILCDNFGGEFMQIFNGLSAKCGLAAKSVRFKDYKSRWGCCDRAGNIIFNYKLLMLPEELWEYVILHELCHIVHMNHSAAFYALLSSLLPDCKLRQRRLKRYALLTRLY